MPLGEQHDVARGVGLGDDDERHLVARASGGLAGGDQTLLDLGQPGGEVVAAAHGRTRTSAPRRPDRWPWRR